MEINSLKTNKPLAEDCFKIKLSDFGKKLLYPVNTEKMDNYDLLCNKENKVMKGKQGYFAVQNGAKTMHAFYSVDQNKTPKVLKIKFQKEKSDCGGTEQDIELEEDIATFGIRPFFTCACGKYATVLYKLPDEYVFKCRTCANITYESQRMNKHTLQGTFYYAHKIIKLAKMREGIKRMFYRGGLSRKAKRFKKLYAKYSGEINQEVRIKTENYLFSVAKKGTNMNEELAQFF